MDESGIDKSGIDKSGIDESGIDESGMDESGNVGLLSLPDEILIKYILSQIDVNSLANVSQTCSRFYALSKYIFASGNIITRFLTSKIWYHRRISVLQKIINSSVDLCEQNINIDCMMMRIVSSSESEITIITRSGTSLEMREYAPLEAVLRMYTLEENVYDNAEIELIPNSQSSQVTNSICDMTFGFVLHLETDTPDLDTIVTMHFIINYAVFPAMVDEKIKFVNGQATIHFDKSVIFPSLPGIPLCAPIIISGNDNVRVTLRYQRLFLVRQTRHYMYNNIYYYVMKNHHGDRYLVHVSPFVFSITEFTY